MLRDLIAESIQLWKMKIKLLCRSHRHSLASRNLQNVSSHPVREVHLFLPLLGGGRVGVTAGENIKK